jgi:hypothetical protein
LPVKGERLKTENNNFFPLVFAAESLNQIKKRRNKMKFNLATFSRYLLVVGLLATGAVFSAQAQPRLIPPAKPALSSNVVFKEKAFPVQITPTDFSSNMAPRLVSGTGQIRLSGTLTNANGCCARFKVTITRLVIGRTGGQVSASSSVFKEQTFEMCGSLQVNITDNLSASEDDARFGVKVENIDPWNKTTISGNLTFRYPTADKILTGQPSVKFDLPQGIEANRTFTLSPNTPGKLKVKISFAGNTQVRVTLKKPNNTNARPPVTGASGLEFEYDITAADIASGNTWTVNVLNLNNTPANDVDVVVTYTVEQ